MARPIIIDCDPGIDDCVALMAALASPDALDVRAILTVAGNVPVDVCTRNALGLVTLAGRTDVPVFAGCPRPMVVDPVFADHIHGESGLGHAELPEPAVSAGDEHAVDALIRLLGNADTPVTMVITGPMTNLAVALVKAPEIANSIDRLVIMGGAREAGGNITASAEFNIYADPHAASIVLACGRPITLIGLDATLQLRCTPARMHEMEAGAHPACMIAHEMIGHVNRIYGDVYGAEGAALHDPCTIAYLLAPELFSHRRAAAAVETGEGLTRGHTAIDIYAGPDVAGQIDWVTQLEADSVFDLLLERMRRL